MRTIINKRLTLPLLLLACGLLSSHAGKADSNTGKKVIAHYTRQGDTLKLKAAEFLLTNMKHHYSYSSPLLDEYYSRAREIGSEYKYPSSIIHFQNLYRELGNIGEGKEVADDTDSISANALISNIDAAFNDWRHGRWASHLTFDQFCEFLLPYRIGTEKYETWRDTLRNMFYGYADEQNGCDERRFSAYWAASSVCDGIKKFNFHVDDKALPKTDVELPLSVIMAMRMGECSNYAKLTTYIMRACGIPVCYDFTPQWPNKAHHHSWNALLDNTGKTIPFLGSETYPGQPDRAGEKMAKVYRKTFAYQHSSVYAVNMANYGEPIPPTLDSPFIKDVSDEYFNGGTVTLTIPETNMKRHLVYLAVFDNQNWTPVDYAVIDSLRHATFSSLGREIVYMPVFWGRNGAIPCGNPFLIASNGSIKPFKPDLKSKVSINVTRKYPVFGRMFRYAKAMRGGYFEASDSADFKNAVKVAEITYIPSLWYNDVAINTGGCKYRYWRYKAPNGSKGNIAELEFYRSGSEVPVVAPLCDDMRYNGRKANNANDKKKLTYYESNHQRGAWAGADFGEPVAIDKIRFMPRNDDNHVEPGHIYQLCYFENGKEIPVGTQTAKSDAITFSGIPTDALYILHDLSSGTEERIFSYDGENIYWY